MSLIGRLLQALAILVLAVVVVLLVYDPRLRELAVQDLSLLTQVTKSSDSSTSSSQPEKTKPGPTGEKGASSDQSSPVTTESGYTISRRCALWSAEGLDLYYSPIEPTTICVQPPGSDVQPGTQAVPGDNTQIPPNCAFAPDGRVYCLAEGQLSADTLQGLYERGQLAP